MKRLCLKKNEKEKVLQDLKMEEKNENKNPKLWKCMGFVKEKTEDEKERNLKEEILGIKIIEIVSRRKEAKSVKKKRELIDLCLKILEDNCNFKEQIEEMEERKLKEEVKTRIERKPRGNLRNDPYISPTPKGTPTAWTPALTRPTCSCRVKGTRPSSPC